MFSLENCPRSVSGGTVALRLTSCKIKKESFNWTLLTLRTVLYFFKNRIKLLIAKNNAITRTIEPTTHIGLMTV